MKDKIIWSSQGEENAFEKNTTSLMIEKKETQQGGDRENIPQHNTGHKWQTQSKHHIQWWKTEKYFSKIKNKTSIPLSST